MRAWIVRFGSMYAFNVLVLLVAGWLTPARVGWNALWSAVILTLATLFLKPLLARLFRGAAAGAARRAGIGERLTEYLVVYLVALGIWVVTFLFSGSDAGGFGGWILPPFILLIGWAVYDVVDDRIEAHTGALYDRAFGGTPPASTASPGSAPATETGRRELRDGLTDEQRRLLDEL